MGTLTRLGLAVVLTSVVACSSDDSGEATTSASASSAGTASSGASGGASSGASGGASTGNGAGPSGPGGSGGSGGSGASGGSGGVGQGGVGGAISSGGAGGSGGGGPMTVCAGDCHYVRAGASGDGSGSDWTNASTSLPNALTRGHVYFVAVGTYPEYTFNDGPSGSDTIRVLRATAGDHGTDTGWDASYAQGTAEFGPLEFTTAYYEFDGRGATRVVGTYQSTVVDIGGSNVTFRGSDVDGNFQASGGNQTDGACTGMNVSGDDVVVEGNEIHDAADDGVSMGDATGISFRGNVVHALHGCGTDGGCGPCYNGHSDGLEIYHVTNSEFVGNLVYDVASTSTFFFGNWADELGNGAADYCQNILLANNILYSPDTGFVAYLEDVDGVALYNNVLWGLHQGAYGGLAIGTHVKGLELYNNAILSINYTHLGSSYNAAEHHGDYNLFGLSLGQWSDHANDIEASDPEFVGIADIDGPPSANPSPSDFAPGPNSPLRNAGYAGDANIQIPSTDFFGAPRDSTPNIGAIE